MYRDENVVAFFPLEPATLGHTLVVPRVHVADIWSLEDETAAQLARATVHVANAVNRAMDPDGLNVIQSNGEAASQTVMHLHVHIVPRWKDDALGKIWPPETEYPEAAKDIAWERIKEEANRQGNSTAHLSIDPEDRRKHLDFLQAVVTRMSAASTATKGWLLPVITATYGYAVTQGSTAIAVLGLLAVAVFAIVDANYLNQERAFRALYDAVAGGATVEPFSMDPSLAASDAGGKSGGAAARWSTTLRRWIPSRAVWSSWAIGPLYGSLLLAGVLIVAVQWVSSE